MGAGDGCWVVLAAGAPGFGGWGEGGGAQMLKAAPMDRRVEGKEFG